MAELSQLRSLRFLDLVKQEADRYLIDGVDLAGGGDLAEGVDLAGGVQVCDAMRWTGPVETDVTKTSTRQRVFIYCG